MTAGIGCSILKKNIILCLEWEAEKSRFKDREAAFSRILFVLSIKWLLISRGGREDYIPEDLFFLKLGRRKTTWDFSTFCFTLSWEKRGENVIENFCYLIRFLFIFTTFCVRIRRPEGKITRWFFVLWPYLKRIFRNRKVNKYSLPRIQSY